MTKSIEELTSEELEKELITCDGKGKDFKIKTLQELVSRARLTESKKTKNQRQPELFYP